MIRFIHLERRFEKELEALWKRGEMGAAAAQKANDLLAALTQNGSPDLKKVWKLTGWGEKRIEGCLKYDLGDGLRVICFRRRETLFVSYLGTHDDCHNWLDHFSGRHNWVAKENGTTISVHSTGSLDCLEAVPSNEGLGNVYDYILPDQIDDKTLRKIFSGLVKNGKQPVQND
jgi:hypothetical protein